MLLLTSATSRITHRARVRAVRGDGGYATQRIAACLFILAIEVVLLFPPVSAQGAENGSPVPIRQVVAIPRHAPRQNLIPGIGERTAFSIAVAGDLAQRAAVSLLQVRGTRAVRCDLAGLRDKSDGTMGAVQADPKFVSLYHKWQGEAGTWWQHDRLSLALGSLLMLSVIVFLLRYLPTQQQNRRLRRELELKVGFAQATGESEQRYRTLVENAPEAIAVLDMEAGHFVDCNNNFLEMFKLDKESFLYV